MFFFFFQAEDGIRDSSVTGVQTCALPIWEFDVATSALDDDLPLHWQMEHDRQPSHRRSAFAISRAAEGSRRTYSSGAPLSRHLCCEIPGRWNAHLQANPPR